MSIESLQAGYLDNQLMQTDISLMPISAHYKCNWLFSGLKSVFETFFRIDKIITSYYSTDIKETKHWSGAQMIIKF